MDYDKVRISLNQYFGALTSVCVVPLLNTELTPALPLMSSTSLKHSEFDSLPTSLDACVNNQCSTLTANSDTAELRFILGGTRYLRVRLAFYP